MNATNSDTRCTQYFRGRPGADRRPDPVPVPASTGGRSGCFPARASVPQGADSGAFRGPPTRVNLFAVPVDLPAPALGSGPPPAAWLAAVNRQSLAVRLLATTVHDVNNILQVMSGAAEVLALDPTPAAIAKRTASIVGQSTAATAVLHNLMTFVRADGPVGEGARPIALAQQALAFRQHAFRKLRLTAVAEGDDIVCAVPRHDLQQVLLNLVLNAEQALSGQTGGVIRVTVHDGEMVTIAVEDNGPGIPEARGPAIFGWPPVPGPSAGALGIGLRVARRLVEAAGGTLAIQAPPAGGTTIVVTVPRLAVV